MSKPQHFVAWLLAFEAPHCRARGFAPITLQCDKTGASMRQNGLSIATKWVKRCDIMGAPREHCDKTGAGSLFAQHSVAKGANPP